MTSSLKTTPTGTQSAEVLTLRRVIVGVLNGVTFLALALWAADILGAGGWTGVDIALFIAFLAILPWTVLGFWNAVIGLTMLHGVRDPLGQTAPFAKNIDPDAPITLKTAVFMTLRNEDPARALHRMKLIKRALDEAGQGAHFGYFLLSDTNKEDVAAEEEAGFAAWKAEVGDAPVFYRRRTDNTGYKAGNVADFVNRWGDDYDLMLPLDADSLMDASTILTGVRQMQAHPKIGILQTLVVGMPSNSAFARIFQFGMRQGMRSYINGQAWWTGECGQFWGHNAFVRIAPFREACELPVLSGAPPFGGHILSHDQVEATFMRRAGFEVRIVPRECGSWEENPPTLLEFMRRNTRWCQGNLQYFKLLDTPGLYPVSRFQLIWAILMFVSVPGWTFLLMLAAMKPFDAEGLAGFPAGSALALYLVFLIMNQAPKLAGILDVLLTSGGARRYGGAGRFLFAAAVEMAHSWLLGAVDSFRTTVFILGLLFGKSVTWGGQARDAHGVEWGIAASNLWPQTLFGVVVVGAMASQSLAFALWSLPITLGYLIAIPFCVVTADPAAGAFLKRYGLFGVPEEFDTPEIVRKAQAN
ncbi:MAG: glucans biosynthesis glucosyltransferase MdoH [Proteobacteria bacterium]|nr:glucans biosynthesis glucosyltransferase MdoH [Pseudomonadota bacterium]